MASTSYYRVIIQSSSFTTACAGTQFRNAGGEPKKSSTSSSSTTLSRRRRRNRQRTYAHENKNGENNDEITSASYAASSSSALMKAASLAAEPRPYPPNRPYQQTLKKAFTLAGYGLHSGEDEIVRVCPAYANEGRYFVRVSDEHIEGTVLHRQLFINNKEGDKEDTTDRVNEEVNKMLLERAKAMLSNDPADREKILERQSILKQQELDKFDLPNQFLQNKDGEIRIRANLENMGNNLLISNELNAPGTNERAIMKPEHLLSALEALGIDNCRIEVGGTGEVPILDGGASIWVNEICKAGVVTASDLNDASGEKVAKKQFKPKEPIIVRDKDAFIMFTPQDKAKISYGIDLTYKSTAVGKQWYSWTPLEDGRYDDEIASARTFGTIQDFMAYYRHDIVKGGTASCSLIANGVEFLNPPMLYNWENECARHKVLDLIGDMSLMAEPGMSGIPIGHVLCHKATHQLHAEFMRQLVNTQRDVVDCEVWVSEEQVLKAESEHRSLFD